MAVRFVGLAAAVAAIAATATPASADTFSFAGGEQSYLVPAGVTQVQVTAIGAAARSSFSNPGATPGRGARVTGALNVTPLTRLYIEVGGQATDSIAGFNGGAVGYGGGASDARTIPAGSPGSLDSRLIVAGGGGGPGSSAGRNGGDAGAAAGPAAIEGKPGSESGGGNAGSGGVMGTYGAGGSGASGAGGGGGGRFGGGGGGRIGTGGGTFTAYGGGGGSSLVPAGGTVSLAALGTGASVTVTPTGGGGGAGGGGGSNLAPRDTVKPTLRSFAISPSAFAAANSGPVVTSAAGGRVFYRLSEPAATRFTVQKPSTGRRSGKKCVKRTKKNKKKRKCTRYTTLKGSFTRQGKAGLNDFKFMGRLNKKALRKGRYRLAAVATDGAGNRSKPTYKAFRIK